MTTPPPESPESTDPTEPTAAAADSSQPDDPATTPDASQDTLGAPRPEGTGPERDPDDWVTGDDPMTGPQRSFLDNLARQAGEEIPADLTKAQASEHIERLQAKLGRTDQG